MISNTSLQRWDRITAKSIDTQFMRAMQQGLNCSPFEALCYLFESDALFYEYLQQNKPVLITPEEEDWEKKEGTHA